MSLQYSVIIKSPCTCPALCHYGLSIIILHLHSCTMTTNSWTTTSKFQRRTHTCLYRLACDKLHLYTPVSVSLQCSRAEVAALQCVPIRENVKCGTFQPGDNHQNSQPSIGKPHKGYVDIAHTFILQHQFQGCGLYVWAYEVETWFLFLAQAGPIL